MTRGMQRAVIVAATLSLVGAVVGAVPAAAASPVLRVCSANIQHTPDMPDWKVRADAAEARAHCDVVLWQEIRERADHRALAAAGWRTTSFQPGGVPISWRTSRVASAGAGDTVRVSRGTPPCANGPSWNPSRYVTLKPLRVRATGQQLTAVSLHFPQRRTKCHQAITSQRWRDAFRNTRAHLPRGAVVVGGDWNRREAEIGDMIAGQHWISPDPRGLDHVFVARTGWQVTGRFTRDLHSDHHLIGTRLRG